jgi:hypothetical protein
MAKSKANRCGVWTVECIGPYEALLVLEACRSRGWPAWWKGSSLRNVAVECRRREVERLKDELKPSAELLFVRLLEGVREAILRTGGEPSSALTFVLTRMRSTLEARPGASGRGCFPSR